MVKNDLHKLSINSIAVVVFTFFLLFDPKLIGFNLQHICGIIGWIYIIIHFRCIRLKTKKVFFLMLTLFYIALYLSIISIINGNTWYGISMHFVYFIIDIIPACILISDKANNSSDRKEYTKSLLYMTAYIQAFFAFVALLFPQFQMFVIDRMATYGYTKVYSLAVYRMYGLAVDLTYTTPIFQSAMSVIAIYDTLYNGKNKVLSALIFFGSAVINARVSIVIVASGLIVVLLTGKKSTKVLLRIVLTTIVVLVFFGIFLKFFVDKESETYVWIESGIQSIFDMFKGNTTTTYGGEYYYTSFFRVLFDNSSWSLPTGLALLFGVGFRVMGRNKYNVASDFGFNNDIWAGGIVYSIVAYMCVSLLINKVAKSLSTEEGIRKRDTLFIKWFMFIVFIIANLKGYVISANECTRTLLLLYLTFCCFY